MSDEGDKLILLPHRLDKNKLDYSVDSLHEIDKWLGAIYTINKLEAGEGHVGDLFMMDGRGDNSVTFAGLYLGEVVRQNASHDWVWQPFEVFVAKNPAHAEYFGDEPGFDTYVLVSSQGAATPLNAALKRVINGSIDSVHYIATFLLDPIDMDAALSGESHTGLSATGPVPDGTFIGTPSEDPEAEFESLKEADPNS